MLDAAQKAIQFTQGLHRQDLNENEVLSLAIVRLVEIFGEAAKNVSPEDREQSPRPRHPYPGDILSLSPLT